MQNDTSRLPTILRMELQRRAEKNPSYGVRAFARSLGISPAMLSKTLNGKANISKKMLDKLAALLEWDAQTVDAIRDDISFARPIRILGGQFDQTKIVYLNDSQFDVIKDWYHYAILELIEVKDFEPKAEWISERLNVPVEKIERAISNLIEVGLLELGADGKFIQKTTYNTTLPAERSTQAHRERQRQVLALAAQVMDEVDISQREQSSMTIALDPDLIPVVKEKVQKFRRALATFLDGRGRKKTKVYEISFSIFPLTKEPQK